MDIAHVTDSESDTDHAPTKPLKKARKLQTFGPWFVALVVIGSCGITLRPPLHAFSIEVARGLENRCVQPPAAAPLDPSIAWVDEDDDEQLAVLPALEPAVPEAVEVPDAAAAIELAVIADLEHNLVPEWPAVLDGSRLTVEDENIDPAHHYFSRLKVRCNNPTHFNCTTSRSTNLQTEVFGRKAALYYLGAWLAANDMSEADHKKHKPTVADMRSYIASQGS